MGADFYALKPVSYGDLKFLILRVMEIGLEDPREGRDFLLN
jgi:hypothetical protein